VLGQLLSKIGKTPALVNFRQSLVTNFPNLKFLKAFVGHGPLVHRNKGYGPIKKKRYNKYLKLGFNHRSLIECLQSL